jgi:T5orf172 domain
MKQKLHELLTVDLSQLSAEELKLHVEELKKWRKKDFHQLLDDESNDRPEHQGFIYVLSNKAMPGLLKIGSTSGPVQKRTIELSTTGVPERFKLEQSFVVYGSLKQAERRVHKALALYRENMNREFFRLPSEVAVALIKSVLCDELKSP